MLKALKDLSAASLMFWLYVSRFLCRHSIDKGILMCQWKHQPFLR